MQCRSAPAASSSASAAGHRDARVRFDRGLQLELAAGEHDRHAVRAHRPRDQHSVPGPQPARGQRRSWVDEPDAGGADVHAVRPAVLDDLRVARDHLHAGRRRGAGHRLRLGAQLHGRQALLEHQRERQRERSGARDCQVVDGPVDRQLADRAAREAQRPDHEAVGRDGERGVAHRQRAGILQPFQAFVRERRNEQALDQGLRGTTAGAVGHRDALVAHAGALGPRRLDDLADALPARIGAHQLTPSRRRAGAARSCSRQHMLPRGRPCTRRSPARACTRCRRPDTPKA